MRHQKQIDFENMLSANAQKETAAFHAALPQFMQVISQAMTDNKHIEHKNWSRTVCTIRDHYLTIKAQSKLAAGAYDRSETELALNSIIMLFNSFTGLTNGRLQLEKTSAKKYYGIAAYVERFELKYH